MTTRSSFAIPATLLISYAVGLATGICVWVVSRPSCPSCSSEHPETSNKTPWVIAKTYPVIQSDKSLHCQWETRVDEGETFDLSLHIAGCAKTSRLNSSDWRLARENYGVIVSSDGSVLVKVAHESIVETTCTNDAFLTCMKSIETSRRRLQVPSDVQISHGVSVNCPALQGLQADACEATSGTSCNLVSSTLTFETPTFYKLRLVEYSGYITEAVLLMFQMETGELITFNHYWPQGDVSKKSGTAIILPKPTLSGTIHPWTNEIVYRINTTTDVGYGRYYRFTCNPGEECFWPNITYSANDSPMYYVEGFISASGSFGLYQIENDPNYPNQTLPYCYNQKTSIQPSEKTKQSLRSFDTPWNSSSFMINLLDIILGDLNDAAENY